MLCEGWFARLLQDIQATAARQVLAGDATGRFL
jgi:hypothetical protein